MANLSDIVTGFVAGTDLEIQRTIDGIPEGQTLAEAWLTVKLSLNDPDTGAVLSKRIVPTDTPGTGQITDPGADGQGAVRFDLSASDSDPLYVRHEFDIWVRTNLGKVYPSNLGIIKGARPVKQTIT